MNDPEAKADLHGYLRAARETLLWKLDGLGEYDLRRPLTPTGTNLLGLVKHLVGCELGYFGHTFARPFPDTPPWLTDPEPHADMWARSDETRQQLLDWYQRACQHSDATIDALPLHAPGHVAAWPDSHNAVTLHRILVHMTAETQRHTGHADILRELLDGTTGWHETRPLMGNHDTAGWQEHRDRVERAAHDASR